MMIYRCIEQAAESNPQYFRNVNDRSWFLNTHLRFGVHCPLRITTGQKDLIR